MPKNPPTDPNSPDVWRKASELKAENRQLAAQTAILDHVSRAVADQQRRILAAVAKVRSCPQTHSCTCLEALYALLPTDTDGSPPSGGLPPP